MSLKSVESSDISESGSASGSESGSGSGWESDGLNEGSMLGALQDSETLVSSSDSSCPSMASGS